MKTKKTTRADLENKKTLFLQIGLVLALSIVFYSFERESISADKLAYGYKTVEIIDEIIPITVPEPPKPEITPPEAPVVIENIIEIANDSNNEDNVDDLNNDETNKPVNPTIYTFEPDTNTDTEEVIPFVEVHEKPMFPGGENEMLRFLSSNTTYPVPAKENNIEGTVYISFVIGKDGAVSNVSVARGIHPSLDNEALRVVAKMPCWKPGKQREIPVAVSYVIPIKFKLY